MIYSFLINWLLSHGIRILVIILAAFVINHFLKTFVKRVIISRINSRIQKEDARKRAETLMSVFGGTFKFLISLAALLMILPEFGVNIAALLAGVGIMGLAVGMAAREIIADFIAGIFIILEDQFRIGDKIKVANIEGRVKEITLRKTIIEDEEKTLHAFPNGQIKIVAKKKH